MKKKYVVPESKVFAINLSENIAASGGISQVEGAAVITFTHQIDGCRGYYSGLTTAPVTITTNNFYDYYDELRKYGQEAYFNCFSYNFG